MELSLDRRNEPECPPITIGIRQLIEGRLAALSDCFGLRFRGVVRPFLQDSDLICDRITGDNLRDHSDDTIPPSTVVGINH